MTALIRIYDNVTADTKISIALNLTAIANSVYAVYPRKNLLNNLTIAVCACAGSILALLANKYIAHNNTIQNHKERNTVYSTLSITVGFTQFHTFNLYSRIYLYTFRIFESLSLKCNPLDLLYGLTIGYLATQLVCHAVDIFERNQQG